MQPTGNIIPLQPVLLTLPVTFIPSVIDVKNARSIKAQRALLSRGIMSATNPL